MSPYPEGMIYLPAAKYPAGGSPFPCLFFTFRDMNRKAVFLFGLFCLALSQARADAGFSIRRKTPTCRIVFSGTDKLGGYTLVTYSRVYQEGDSLLQQPRLEWIDTINDQSAYYADDSRKRFDESDRDQRFMLLDPSGRPTDSLRVYLKKYNYKLVITGVKDGKLQYQLERKKAVFEYGLVENDDNEARNKIYRWVFIATSLAGFALLTWLFLRRRKAVTA